MSSGSIARVSASWSRCAGGVGAFLLEKEPEGALANGPRSGKTKALPQSQHRLEALSGSARRAKALEAAAPRHVLLQPGTGRSRSLAEGAW